MEWAYRLVSKASFKENEGGAAALQLISRKYARSLQWFIHLHPRIDIQQSSSDDDRSPVMVVIHSILDWLEACNESMAASKENAAVNHNLSHTPLLVLRYCLARIGSGTDGTEKEIEHALWRSADLTVKALHAVLWAVVDQTFLGAGDVMELGAHSGVADDDEDERGTAETIDEKLSSTQVRNFHVTQSNHLVPSPLTRRKRLRFMLRRVY